MAKKTKRQNETRQLKKHSPPDPATIKTTIDDQRQTLTHAVAIVHSNAELLHESYQFELGEPDLGLCCEVVGTMLMEAVEALLPLAQAPKVTNAADRSALTKALEAQRRVLFRAQAVVQLIKLRLAAHDFREHNDADLSVVFSSIDLMLDRCLTELEPVCLGLPIPAFETHPGKENSRF